MWLWHGARITASRTDHPARAAPSATAVGVVSAPFGSKVAWRVASSLSWRAASGASSNFVLLSRSGLATHCSGSLWGSCTLVLASPPPCRSGALGKTVTLSWQGGSFPSCFPLEILTWTTAFSCYVAGRYPLVHWLSHTFFPLGFFWCPRSG
jgi:hypothetical protein